MTIQTGQNYVERECLSSRKRPRCIVVIEVGLHYVYYCPIPHSDGHRDRMLKPQFKKKFAKVSVTI